MATKKRKTTTRRSTSRKKRAEQRLPAGLGTLFAGLLLVGLAFVEGDSVWKTLHQVLFGLFGCGSFVLGAAVCCLGRAVHTGRGSAAPHLQAGAGARVCKRHGDRVFRHPAAGAVGLPDGGGLLPERLSGVAVRRRTGCGAGRQPAAALRPAGGKLHHAGAGALRQPVHF